MFNLHWIFEKALISLKETQDVNLLGYVPLVVLSDQNDVINHLEYAVSHYLPTSLDVPYLQNSSVGSPYKKWAKFTNEDFGHFDHVFWLLMQNTSRMWHETFTRNIHNNWGRNDFEKSILLKEESNIFTSLICDKKYNDAYIGIVINEGISLNVHSISIVQHRARIETKTYEISNRSVLSGIIVLIKSEIVILRELHKQYKEQCGRYISTGILNTKMKQTHESYWTINRPNNVAKWTL